MDDLFLFFERRFPSANMIVLKGDQPVLVDSGFGSDIVQTVELLRDTKYPPDQLQLLVNTHYHCDHCGGNSVLQRHFGMEVATHRWEAQMVNSRHPEACSAEWLDQPIEPYVVNRELNDGDIIDTGTYQWQVIHTPGHTLGHISLYCEGVLIAGDTFHADDVAWLNPFREGANGIFQMRETLDRLAQLPLQRALSGHGKINENPLKQIDEARWRYDRWLKRPDRIAWHAIKRIFTYALMLFDGMTDEQLRSYLLSCPWYQDYCLHFFYVDPSAFVDDFLQELDRSQATVWREDKLYPTAPYHAPTREWLDHVPRVLDWD